MVVNPSALGYFFTHAYIIKRFYGISEHSLLSFLIIYFLGINCQAKKQIKQLVLKPKYMSFKKDTTPFWSGSEIKIQ